MQRFEGGRIMFIKKTLMFMFCFLVVITSLNSAVTAARYKHYMTIPVSRLVNAVDSGNFDHKIYYWRNNKSLILVCRAVFQNGVYGIRINGRNRTDYASAIEEAMIYWLNQGKFKNCGPINTIHLVTCHEAFNGRSKLYLPNLGVNLFMLAPHYGRMYYEETYNVRTGEIVELVLYYEEN